MAATAHPAWHLCSGTVRKLHARNARILLDGERLGAVCLYDDIVHPGTRVFVIHLNEDPRGPGRMRERHRVRGEIERMVDTHPLWWVGGNSNRVVGRLAPAGFLGSPAAPSACPSL